MAPKLVFGDGDRVLDKGVWKRWKACQYCQQVVVERAKWKDCWDEIRFCSDRCKAEAKRQRRQQELQQQQEESGGADGASGGQGEQKGGGGTGAQGRRQPAGSS